MAKTAGKKSRKKNLPLREIVKRARRAIDAINHSEGPLGQLVDAAFLVELNHLHSEVIKPETIDQAGDIDNLRSPLGALAYTKFMQNEYAQATKNPLGLKGHFASNGIQPLSSYQLLQISKIMNFRSFCKVHHSLSSRRRPTRSS